MWLGVELPKKEILMGDIFRGRISKKGNFDGLSKQFFCSKNTNKKNKFK
jgi:hypothetical protein